MYALKARDKLHKREKEMVEEERETRRGRGREQQAHHRGESGAAGRRKEPSTCHRESKYMGTFSLQMGSGWKNNIGKSVKQQLSRINPKDTAHAVDVTVTVNMEGVKVMSTDGRLIMAHALHRILFSTAEAKKCLFAMVARNPQTSPKDGVYCHIFLLPSKEKANEVSQLVGKAFKTAYARDSFKRDKKSSAGSHPPSQPAPQQHPAAPPTSQQPWTVQHPAAPPTSQQQPWTVQHSAAPPTSQQQPWTVQHPAAPPTSQQQPWTVQHSGPTHQPHPQTDTEPRPPPFAPQSAVHPGPGGAGAPGGAGGDAGTLEVEILSLHSQLHELETRRSHVVAAGGPEEMLLQLVMEISAIQQQIDEKGMQLYALQEHGVGGNHGNSGSSSHANATTSSAAAIGYHDDPLETLPDIESLSLDEAEWFQAGLPREIVMELLSQQPEGAFFVRESSSSPGSYALSLKAPGGKITHYLIHEQDGKYCLQGSSQLFPSMVALILHHTVESGPLPCTLSLATANPIFTEQDPFSFPELPAGGGEGEFFHHHNYHLLD